MRDLIERLEERVTGVTRMQLDNELQKLLKIGKSPRQAVLEIEKMYKLKDVRLNSKGDTVVYFEDINDAISEEKVEPPPGYRGRTVKTKVKYVDYDIHSDAGIQFLIKSRVYDAYLKDEIGSVSFGIEKTIKIFSKAGYSDDEIEEVFDRASKAGRVVGGIELPKPVTISFTVFERSFGK